MTSTDAYFIDEMLDAGGRPAVLASYTTGEADQICGAVWLGPGREWQIHIRGSGIPPLAARDADHTRQWIEYLTELLLKARP
jgi:hypothetical protein